MSESNPGRAALLVVDMQVGLFAGPQAPYRGESVLDHINELVRRARAANVPVFLVQHTGPQGSPIERGSDAWQLLPPLAEVADACTVFEKTAPSCFKGTPLHEMLQAASVERLYIVGMKTQYCIDTTCRVASELGYRPVLVADAHTCMDTEAASAETIIRHHNATLGGLFAERVNTRDVRFECGSSPAAAMAGV